MVSTSGGLCGGITPTEPVIVINKLRRKKMHNLEKQSTTSNPNDKFANQKNWKIKFQVL